MKAAKTTVPRNHSHFVILLAVLLAVLFAKSFLPGYVHFSNDGPLGAQNAQWVRLPAAFTGAWGDLNDIGASAGAYPLDLTSALRWALGPVGFSKFFPPLAIFLLGLGAWTLFRQLKLSPLAAALGALAAALNSTFFASACWGVGSQEIGIAMDFFALALVVSNTPETAAAVRWTRLALAGLCVGLNVMEGADIGALFSIFIAAFVFFKAAAAETGPVLSRLARGVGRVAVIALFAGFIAAQTVAALIGTAITGVVGMSPSSETSEQHWDWATQWSLPKIETLGLVVPGLFGYKMDTPNNMLDFLQPYYQGGNYWGGVGRDPIFDRFLDKRFQPGDRVTINLPEDEGRNAVLQIEPDGTVNLPVIGRVKVAGLTGLQLKETIDQAYAARGLNGSVQLPPASFMRFTGGGNYVGILVALVVAWTIAQAFRRPNSVFDPAQRRLIGFLTAVGVVTLLLAWGRFAPFYGWLYQLPYVSTSRNPTKFLMIFSFALVILFAYGIHGLSRRYLDVPASNIKSSIARLQSWWRNARGFDRRWTWGCLIVFAASVVAWIIYAQQKPALVRYLQAVGFDNKDLAGQIAGFSIGQAGWFLLFFAAAILLCLLVLAGIFSGPRAKIGGVLLGALLIADLGRANLPWITYWNYIQKYDIDPDQPGQSTNPIINFLRDKPYQHRVAILHSQTPLEQLYEIEWAQHQFLYYDIQSLDIVQRPRVAADIAAYDDVLSPRGTPGTLYLMVRHWQLTNTRYLLGPTAYLDSLNQDLDPVQKRFRIVKQFDIVPKPGVMNPTQYSELTARLDPNGPYALFEFTGALPRAKLYFDWETNTADELKHFTTNGLDALDRDAFFKAGTNDFITLQKLVAPAFDPWKTVLLAVSPAVPPSGDTNAISASSATVHFVAYAPKDITLRTEAPAPTVLLLNDKYDPNWRVTVDGQPAPLLRANFIMRGVYLPAGGHTVEFQFRLPMRPFYVTLAAIVVGVFLCGFLVVSSRRPVSPSRQP
ncbi:MAG TPA: polysaccharide biosynthesis/export family protein [Verrucomicrobiae bacterium]|nr:polysaccharide biosynthesis/export family protein [Verrucomicrobiae bacterium]